MPAAEVVAEADTLAMIDAPLAIDPAMARFGIGADRRAGDAADDRTRGCAVTAADRAADHRARAGADNRAADRRALC